MLNTLEEHFPSEYTPNESQEKLLKNIGQAFEEGHKFVVCSAPTGTGKSFLAKTLGNASKEASANFKRLINSNLAFEMKSGEYAYERECLDEGHAGGFVLTITKSLQDQYNDLFPDIKVMKGQGNYKCDIDDTLTVDIAPCLYLKGLKRKCQAAHRCPYYNARSSALSSKFSTLNYTMFFTLPMHVKQKEYIVCDEASELEGELVKHFTCDINFKFLKKQEVEIPATPTDENYAAWGKWVPQLQYKVFVKADELKNTIEHLEKNKDGKSKLKLEKIRGLYLALKTCSNDLAQLGETWYDSEYQIDRFPDSIRFTPLKVNTLSKYIFNSGKKVLLMSATIIDPEHFCKTLGIDKFKYVEVDSIFDAKKAPIWATQKLKLNSKNIEANLPLLAAQIQKICDMHKDVKGLIHTHTHMITKFMQENLLGTRFLFREPGVSNERLMEMHTETDEPTVLVSPSMTHGIDLKGDLSRFQVIIKAPYLPLGDTRVKKLFKLDPVWYTNQMLSSVIQACGRSIRSKEDHCTTYILDGTITKSILDNSRKIPNYFLDRFK